MAGPIFYRERNGGLLCEQKGLILIQAIDDHKSMAIIYMKKRLRKRWSRCKAAGVKVAGEIVYGNYVVL